MNIDKSKIKPIIKLPKKFKDELERCLKYNSPNFPFKYNIDYFLFIASKIIYLNSFSKFKNLKKVPISSKIIRMELGKHYKRYLEYLLEFKFINTDNYYIVGKNKTDGKCKCYGLHKRYNDDKVVNYEIVKPSLLKKMLKWQNDKFGKMRNDELLGHLYDMMRTFKVDIRGAKEYLDNEVKNKRLSKRKARLELDKCERINGDDVHSLFLTRDRFGRVHTNFTNISRHIRENFLISENGEKLVQLDVISCQPALLYTLFKNYLNKILDESGKYREDEFYMSPFEITPNAEDVRDKYVNRNNSYSGEHIYKNSFNPTIKSFGFKSYSDMSREAIDELGRYKIILKSGLYEFFQDRMDFYFSEEKTRDEIKKEWITHVFGRNNVKYNEKMQSIWEIEFPLLTKILTHFKKGDHKSLAHELQRKESNIIYNKLCPTMNKNKIDYFTVHDCIVVKESDADFTYDTFEEILNENGVVTGVSL